MENFNEDDIDEPGDIGNISFTSSNIFGEEERLPRYSTQLRENLPTFKFDSAQFRNCGQDNQDKLECRICMVEFKNGEELRQL